jgi:hypothetical protein
MPTTLPCLPAALQAVTTFLKGYRLPQGDRLLLFVKAGNAQSMLQMITVGA